MRRLPALLILLPLIAVACGGGGQKSTPTKPAAVSNPGRTAIVALLHAAVHSDTKALWDLLSKPSQQRLGPSYAAFSVASAPQIEQALKPFESTTITPFISRSVSQQFGIVAIRSGARALAFPLRRENGTWKIETPGPVQFRILGPQPGSRGSVAQIGVEVRSPGVLGDAVVFVDGKPVRPNLTPTPKTATVFANLQPALPAGVHIAVIYAEEGRDASAEAWTFTATKPA
jgi:hypothetical protein